MQQHEDKLKAKAEAVRMVVIRKIMAEMLRTRGDLAMKILAGPANNGLS
jgi:hypothetical protein